MAELSGLQDDLHSQGPQDLQDLGRLEGGLSIFKIGHEAGPHAAKGGGLRLPQARLFSSRLNRHPYILRIDDIKIPTGNKIIGMWSGGQPERPLR